MKTLSLYLLLALCTLTLRAQTTKNAYFIGNSVTDAINLAGLDALAESRGNTHNWGRHMIPGAPLDWIWGHPADGFSESPYGLYPNALGNYTWDVLSLQPFDRQLDAGSGDDVPMAANFINRAKTRSPNMQVYVYSRWPRKQDKAPETADGWNQLWLQTYTGGYDGTNETKDYFEKLTNRLRANHTDIKPVRMVPVGQVFYALNNKMKAGQVPGYSSIWQVYSDGIHMNGVGSYIASCTYFATLYSQSPVGLSVPSQYGTIDPALARVIQETAWSVVTSEPLSGVTGDTGGSTYKAAENPGGTVAGLNYSYYEGTWSALPTFTSLTPVKTGNVATPDLTPRNRNDNFAFQYTGYVNVPADGNYTFYTSSDDGSRLYIGTQLVVDNDGLHGAEEKSGSIGLKAGKHSITVSFFEATGGEVLSVSYSSPALTKTTIPASAFSSVPPAAANRAPTAVLNATPTSGTAPLTVSFNANGSSDPDAGDYILGYEWDFGDGSTFSNSNAPSHTYTSAGTYTAKLRVMDNRNLYSSQVSKTITVSGGTASSLTLNPTDDTDSQSDVVAGTNANLNASKWCHLFLRFSLSSVSGTIASAKLRIYKTSTNAPVISVSTTNTDSWTEGGTKPAIGNLITTQTTTAAAGYVEIDVTNTVKAEAAGDKVASFTLTTDLDGWSGYYSRQNATGKPELVLTYAGSARRGYEPDRSFENAVQLYPNPVADGTMYLSIDAQTDGPARVLLTNSLGQLVWTLDVQLREGNNRVEVPVRGWNGGLYFTTVQQGLQKKVIKVWIP